MKNPLSAAILALTMTASFTASAAVIVDTLSPLAVMPLPGNQSASYVPLDSNPPLPDGAYSVGEAFNFDNQNTSRYLNSVSISLIQYDANGSISVRLYAEDGLIPGNLLASLSGSPNPGTGVATFTPSTPYDLKGAGTTAGYFIVVSGTGYGWNIASVPAWNGQDQAARIDWSARYDSGAGQVGYFSGGSDRPNPTDSNPYALAMQVTTVTAAPEPSTYALAGLGLASLVIFRRRKE